MPSTMIHLLLSHKIAPDAPVEYHIGNIAPDGISTRENYHFKLKDALHFRGSANRLQDIEDLSHTLDMNDPFNEGYITHLYFDMHWDRDCTDKFVREYQDGHWFPAYRRHISLAAAFLYHEAEYLRTTWHQMVQYDQPLDHNVQSVTQDEIMTFIHHTDYWVQRSSPDPSDIFVPDFVHRYTDEIAEQYAIWRHAL